MYDLKKLSSIEYFKGKNVDVLFDDLTKTISRPFIIDYVKELIKNNVSFSLSILDIDNFKDINDKYGHQKGDEVIAQVGKKIVEAVGSTGLVGRYGGDEFLIVTPNLQTYDERWKYLRDLLNKAFRADYNFPDFDMRITSTIGSAAYPADASEYDRLFNMVDKALYRGKQKGRNCFIIYSEAIHYNIDTNSPQGRTSLYQIMNKIGDALSRPESIEQSILNVFDIIIKNYALTDVIYVKPDSSIIKSTLPDNGLEIPYSILNELNYDIKNDGIKVINNNDELETTFPKVHDFCKNDVLKAFTTTLVQSDSCEYGYLVFADRLRKRIWQSDEIILFVYFSRMLGVIIQNRDLKEKLENKD